jgi:hypothetical protein
MKRTAGLAAVAVLLLSGCGGSPDVEPAAAAEPAATAPAVVAVESESAAPPASTAPPSAEPQVETRTVTQTAAIAYSTRTVKDTALAKGKTKVRTKGVAGVRTLTYQVTFVDGQQTTKKLVKSVVTRKPVTKVVAVGAKSTSGGGCDPNYSGACVPIASDVDCAGGSGNGPAYVRGPVRVVGSDIYDLDRDGDGIACD